MGEEILAGDAASDVVVVALGDRPLAKRPEQCAQRQRPMRHRILLDGHLDGEARAAAPIDDGRKAFAKASRPGEQINHRYGILPRHVLVFRFCQEHGLGSQRNSLASRRNHRQPPQGLALPVMVARALNTTHPTTVTSPDRLT